jgi:hypothetical protein
MFKTFRSYAQAKANGLTIEEIREVVKTGILALEFRNHNDVVTIRKMREIFNEEVSDVVWFLLQNCLVKDVDKAEPQKVMAAFVALDEAYSQIPVLNQGNG